MDWEMRICPPDPYRRASSLEKWHEKFLPRVIDAGLRQFVDGDVERLLAVPNPHRQLAQPGRTRLQQRESDDNRNQIFQKDSKKPASTFLLT